MSYSPWCLKELDRIGRLSAHTRNCLLLDGSAVKNPPAVQETRDQGSVPAWGRSSREGNGNPLQDSCLGNPMDGGARRAIVQRIAKELNMTEPLRTQDTVLLSLERF